MKIRFFTLLAALLLSSFAEAQTYDTNTLKNGLVAYYPLNGDANDYSGNGNNGLVINANFTNGRYLKKCINFLGDINSYVRIPDAPSINFTNQFTVFVWAKWNEGWSYHAESILFKTDVWQYKKGFGIGVNQDDSGYGQSKYGGTIFGLYNKNYTGNPVLGDFSFINQWHYYGGTYSNGTITSYLDGNVWGTYQVGEFTNSAADLILGGSDHPVSGAYNRCIQDLRIYNRALSSNEVAALYAMESTPPVPPTTTDTFGSGTNQFGIDFVTVGDPGNSNDTTGYGGVPYSYRIGKYTISQNQVDAATRNGLQNVTAGAWSGDQPAANILWYEAAAYVNWLNTSQGYRPAYNLTYTNGAWSMALWPTTPDTNGNVAWTLGGTNLFRNANCTYFLPSENEWYKAAYYDLKKNGATAGYWRFATASDTSPMAVISGTQAGTAVYCEMPNASPASVYQAGGLSYYGTMGQAGNVWNWIESSSTGSNTNAADNRILRGGHWSDWAYPFPGNSLESNFRFAQSPIQSNYGWNRVGFRIASIDDSWLTNGLLAWYPFDGNANDESKNSNNITINDGFSFSNDRFGKSNGAIFYRSNTSFASSVKNLGISGNSDRSVAFWVHDSNLTSRLGMGGMRMGLIAFFLPMEMDGILDSMVDSLSFNCVVTARGGPGVVSMYYLSMLTCMPSPPEIRIILFIINGII